MAKTVLIVDDVAFVRKTINEILTKAHYQVVGEASDGNEALALFQRLKPDIVTLDIVMPQMSGIETARKLFKLERNVKIVIVSAMGQENLVMEAINVGVKDYVLKPFTPQDILRAIESALYSGNRVIGARAQKDRSG